jgi:hypothetical protein
MVLASLSREYSSGWSTYAHFSLPFSKEMFLSIALSFNIVVKVLKIEYYFSSPLFRGLYL